MVLRLQQQMKKMEKSKYLEPNSSEAVKELVHFMKVYQENLIQGTNHQPSIQPEALPQPPLESKPIDE